MTDRIEAIEIPRIVLGRHLTVLLNDIASDAREEGHLAQPQRISDGPFRKMKFPVMVSGDYSAVVLSAEHVRSIPDFNPSALVGASEWDLEEFALPVLDEWRRRWWASRAVEPAWIAAVRLTDEDLPSWRLRKASGQALPPDVPFSVGDLREAFEVMGWSVIGQGAAWQRMHHPRHALDLLIPPDSASTSAALCRLALIWYQTSDSSPEVMRGSQRDEAETIAQVWRTLGEPQVAALVEELATWENAGAALVRLRAAGSLADERRNSWGRGSRMPSH